ncbi:MAG: ribose ABC transporter permease [Spirochaetae bacterium HGW-Spirochaetae-7]|jgi:ribose transport system permease protein|nr:MAG: ribose ABC transporter permease [Spirochaetae bacterium HGW-Spirochaetae-7]
MTKTGAVKLDLEKYGSLLALGVLFLLATLIGWPYFIQPENLINVMRQSSYTGIIALGMTFVIISGGIDLSVGSMAAFVASCGVIAMNIVVDKGGNETAAILFGVGIMVTAGFLSGAINGLLVTKGKIVPFIVTLGTMSIFRYVSLQMANAGEFASHSQEFGNLGMSKIFSFRLGESAISFPTPVFVLLLLATVLSFVLNNTRYGRYICAVGSNSRVALYSAVRVDRVRFWAYSINGIVVGVSAALLAARFNTVSTPNFGLGFELDAIAAVIIGGTAMAGGRGSVWGTIIGVFMLQIIQNMLNMAGLSPYLQGVVKGVVIIASVYIQRQRQS